MTAQCPAWPHTYLSFSPDQLRPTAFRLPKPNKRFPFSTFRSTTRMTEIERLTCPTCRAGELPPFLLTISFVFCAAQSRVIPAIWRFQVQPRTAATLLSSPVLMKHSDYLALGVALAKKNISGQQMQCLYFAFPGQIPHLLFIMFVVPLAMLGTNALNALPLWV